MPGNYKVSVQSVACISILVQLTVAHTAHLAQVNSQIVINFLYAVPVHIIMYCQGLVLVFQNKLHIVNDLHVPLC